MVIDLIQPNNRSKQKIKSDFYFMLDPRVKPEDDVLSGDRLNQTTINQSLQQSNKKAVLPFRNQLYAINQACYTSTFPSLHLFYKEKNRIAKKMYAIHVVKTMESLEDRVHQNEQDTLT